MGVELVVVFRGDGGCSCVSCCLIFWMSDGSLVRMVLEGDGVMRPGGEIKHSMGVCSNEVASSMMVLLTLADELMGEVHLKWKFKQ